MNSDFVGRAQELGLLKEPNWRSHAQLIVIYGRRRVGKTALVEHAYRHQPLWKFEGIEGADGKRQREQFLSQLSFYCGALPRESRAAMDWNQAFRLLAQELRKRAKENIVVFFDEFQWMAGLRGSLVSLFKFFWDNFFSKNRNHRFVLCGSISSFMVKRIIRSKALYGRVSTEIHLRALSLSESLSFFQGKRSREEVMEIALVLGCIPQYLKELNPALSLQQNLGEYAFSPHGYFFGEYQRIFISHFGRNPFYERVLQALSTGAKTIEELARSCRTKTGGSFTDVLLDLELAGFVERYSPLGKGMNSRQVKYRIQDEYLHFYHSFIRPHEREILSGRFSPGQVFRGRTYLQWQGSAFERLCRSQARLIADRLRISGIEYQAGSWFERARDGVRGTQVDLLFERKDRMLTVCEAKYSHRVQAGPLLRDFEARCEALRERFPRHGIQKVLILGKGGQVPDKVKRYFDVILDAREVFFG